jgi:hypothetical protein
VTRFVCTIDLGNDAMRIPQHVSEALRGVAAVLLRADNQGRRDGSVYDEKGNRVGSWSYHWDPIEGEEVP